MATRLGRKTLNNPMRSVADKKGKYVVLDDKGRVHATDRGHLDRRKRQAIG